MTAERGKIYDCNGSTLAVSYTTYDVYVRGREVVDAVELATYLSKTLSLDYNNTYNKVTIRNVSEVLVKMQISDELAKQIYAKNYKGLFLSESIKRYYPYGDLLTQLLGFTTIDNQGQAGIESYFDNLLKGKDGSFIVQSDLQGKELENALRSYLNGVKGTNIHLTVNAKIQLIVETVLEQIMIEQKAKSVTAIMMNAKTGGIIASSTKPSFNLNEIPRDNPSALMNMMKNTTVVDVYEPGSTFKILTMASAIESSNADLNDRFYCPGYRMVDGQKIKCWKTIGHGSVDLSEGLVNSCNCVFMDLAQRMGTEKFYSYLKNFGLGAKTGIEISGESSGILMKQSSVKNVDLARIGFGQAVAVTPLQLITAICSAVNGGNLYAPTIIQKTSDANCNTLVCNQSVLKRNVVSKNTSTKLNAMLSATVNKTEPLSFVMGYDVGGKTGTAQKYENGAIARGKYISSFVGTYPASNPEYVLLLLVDEPGAGAYYGSVVAAPYAKLIFAQMFETLNIKPQNEDVEHEYVTMPNLIGLSLSEASKKLIELGISYEIDGEGGVIQKQLPPAGTQVDKNDTVLLVTA